MAELRQRLATLVLLAAAAVLVVPAGTASAAAPNQLVAPSLTPAGGPEGTTFGLSVTYQGRHPAITVFAEVSGQTVLLPLISGTDTDGTYAAGVALPMGSHAVVFRADAARGNDPELPGGTIAVTAPTPTPIPTPTPVPPASAPPTTAPTAPPAPTATPAAPAPIAPVAPPPANQAPASPAAPAAPPADGAATPDEAPPTTTPEPPPTGSPEPAAEAPSASASQEAQPIIGASVFGSGPGSTDDLLWTVLMSGIGVIGVVVVFGFLMGRRRQEPATEAVAPVFTAPTVTLDQPRAEDRPRAPAPWELAAQLEDAPLGTTDFAPLPNGLTVGEVPDNVEFIDRPKRMNPRMARMMAARREGGQLWGG